MESAAARLLIKLLKPVLELGQVVDLVLQELNLVVMLTTRATCATVLKLTHLVHSGHNFALRVRVISCLRYIVAFVHNFNRRDVRAIALIISEVDIVAEQEVHEARLLVLGQLGEDESLGHCAAFVKACIAALER